MATSTTLPVAEQALAWLQSQDVLTPGLQRKIRDAVSQGRKSGRDLIAEGLYDRIKRELTESVERGESATEWRDRVKDIGGVTQSQVETIGRTYSHRAYHEGIKTIMDDPVVAEEFPYLQYFATQDTRTRPTHLAMDGKVAHKDSPMAAQMQALLAEWNCRCGSAPLSREDALAIGIDDDTGWVEPDADDVDAAEELPTLEGQPRITEQAVRPKYLRISDPSDVEEFSLRYANWASSLSNSDKEVIEQYGTSLYLPMNRRLRERSGINDYKKEIQHLDKLIESSPETKDDMIVYRGMDASVIDSMDKGNVFLERAYMATSLRKDLVKEHFAYSDQKVMVSILVPKGTKGMMVEAARGDFEQAEFLLGRNSYLKILSRRGNKVIAKLVSRASPQSQLPRIDTQRIDELISGLAPKPPTSSTPAEPIPAKPASALIPVVKSKAKVEAKKADLQAFVDLIKKPADKSAIANIVGATDKAKVTAEYRPNFNELKIYVREKRYYADRQLHRDLNGNLVMENQIFEIKSKADQGKGLGAEIFANQVASARQLGVTKIKTLATRGPNLNGYYTWARLGYDARLPDIIRARLPVELRNAIRLSDLMTTEAGRDWWRANGVTLHMEFDLADDSVSHRVLADYLAEKKAKLGGLALAADVDVGLNVDEQITGISGAANQVEAADELSDEDEAALDRAWARERARRDTANRLGVE